MTEPLQIRALLEDATRRLETLSDSPRLDAELLLARAIDMPRSYLFAHPEEPLDELAVGRFEADLGRRLAIEGPLVLPDDLETAGPEEVGERLANLIEAARPAFAGVAGGAGEASARLEARASGLAAASERQRRESESEKRTGVGLGDHRRRRFLLLLFLLLRLRLEEIEAAVGVTREVDPTKGTGPAERSRRDPISPAESIQRVPPAWGSGDCSREVVMRP